LQADEQELARFGGLGHGGAQSIFQAQRTIKRSIRGGIVKSPLRNDFREFPGLACVRKKEGAKRVFGPQVAIPRIPGIFLVLIGLRDLRQPRVGFVERNPMLLQWMDKMQSAQVVGDQGGQGTKDLPGELRKVVLEVKPANQSQEFFAFLGR